MVTGALVAQSLASDEQRWLMALVAAGAAVVPDIDFVARKASARLLFLKLHRGLTHSLAAVPIIGACAAGSGHLLLGLPLWSTFWISCLAALSHLVLDAVMHSTGLQLLWPFRRRMKLPLLIGLNPLTSSARCAERSLRVCMRCTMHSAILSPLVLLIWAGFAMGLLPTVPWARVSQLTLAAALAYLALSATLRLRAGVLLRRQLREAGGSVVGVYPASFNPARWLGLGAAAGGHTLWALNSLKGTAQVQGHHPASDAGPQVDQSRQTETVAQFLDNAVAPHVSRHGEVVVWRDLAYAFSPTVSLFAVRVRIDQESRVVEQEFRERWDRPPES